MSVSATKQRMPDEETPLLRPNNDCHDLDQTKPKETPLPWAQFSIVLFLQLAEPLTSQVIYPFVPQLVREIGVTNGDDTKIGYYVGMMQSIFFASQALTVLHWSRVSDHIGRKPVILIGLSGLALSMYCFGLARSFGALVFARALNGVLNGNIGVMKSMMGEMTDATNVARAFAFQPIAWSTGATIGPLIGGSLSHPAERFPDIFGQNEFLKTYPYFLPCAIPATFSVVAWFVAYLYLKETNTTGFTFRSLFSRQKHSVSQKSALLTSTPATSTPPALSVLLTRPVIVSGGAYALLSLLDIAFRALQPVFYATPRSLGGLGLPPHEIGRALALLGLANGLFQVLCFARMVRAWGVRRVFLLGIASGAPMFVLFPVMSALVASAPAPTDADATALSWPLLAAATAQLSLTLLLNACYGCVFIYITAAAPSRRTLGAVNGLAQMVVSGMRCVGPALASALYARGLQWEYAEGGGRAAGWAVYGVMLLLVGAAYGAGVVLPERPDAWRDEKEADTEES